MNHMLKRFFAIVLLLSLVTVAATAEETIDVVETIEIVEVPETEIVDETEDSCSPYASCSHSEYELIGDPSDVSPTIMKYNATYHKSAKVMTAICLKSSCAKKITVYVNTQYIAHTFTDNGHSHKEGTYVHQYRQICNACGEETYYEIYCLDCN